MENRELATVADFPVDIPELPKTGLVPSVAIAPPVEESTIGEIANKIRGRIVRVVDYLKEPLQFDKTYRVLLATLSEKDAKKLASSHGKVFNVLGIRLTIKDSGTYSETRSFVTLRISRLPKEGG